MAVAVTIVLLFAFPGIVAGVGLAQLGRYLVHRASGWRTSSRSRSAFPA
jgi:hypothetical protein